MSLNHATAIDLEFIRNNYDKAVKDEKVCKTLIDELSKISGSSIFQGYLGAFETIWANHAIMPTAKISTFNKGKKNIEAAINADPNNIELRYIRLSIQKNCPSFLGYNNNIEADRIFIKSNFQKITSASLKQMCLKII